MDKIYSSIIPGLLLLPNASAGKGGQQSEETNGAKSESTHTNSHSSGSSNAADSQLSAASNAITSGESDYTLTLEKPIPVIQDSSGFKLGEGCVDSKGILILCNHENHDITLMKNDELGEPRITRVIGESCYPFSKSVSEDGNQVALLSPHMEYLRTFEPTGESWRQQSIDLRRPCNTEIIKFDLRFNPKNNKEALARIREKYWEIDERAYRSNLEDRVYHARFVAYHDDVLLLRLGKCNMWKEVKLPVDAEFVAGAFTSDGDQLILSTRQSVIIFTLDAEGDWYVQQIIDTTETADGIYPVPSQKAFLYTRKKLDYDVAVHPSERRAGVSSCYFDGNQWICEDLPIPLDGLYIFFQFSDNGHHCLISSESEHPPSLPHTAHLLQQTDAHTWELAKEIEDYHYVPSPLRPNLFSPDGNFLICPKANHEIFTLFSKAEDGQWIQNGVAPSRSDTDPNAHHSVESASVSPDGSRIIIKMHRILEVYEKQLIGNITTWEKIAQIQTGNPEIAKFHKDRDHILTSTDKGLAIYKLHYTPKPVAQPKKPKTTVLSAFLKKIMPH